MFLRAPASLDRELSHPRHVCDAFLRKLTAFVVILSTIVLPPFALSADLPERCVDPVPGFNRFVTSDLTGCIVIENATCKVVLEYGDFPPHWRDAIVKMCVDAKVMT